MRYPNLRRQSRWVHLRELHRGGVFEPEKSMAVDFLRSSERSTGVDFLAENDKWLSFLAENDMAILFLADRDNRLSFWLKRISAYLF